VDAILVAIVSALVASIVAAIAWVISAQTDWILIHNPFRNPRESPESEPEPPRDAQTGNACPQCGMPYSPDSSAAYCRHCGHPLKEDHGWNPAGRN
jgi:hypothetical protein